MRRIDMEMAADEEEFMNRLIKYRWFSAACMALCVLLAACAGGAGKIPKETKLTLSADGKEIIMDAAALNAREQENGLYTAINNWPTEKTFAARGILLKNLFEAWGVPKPERIVFEAADGYQAALTYDQLFAKRYSFAGGQQTEIEPILAYLLAEGTDEKAVQPCGLTLLLGQGNTFEQTNPVFVENVSKILFFYDAPPKLALATSFPAAGKVKKGAAVKLQHPQINMVKLYYTTDGSSPTEFSQMYNPSVYQPVLNTPIIIEQSMTIKVIAVGYGSIDSDVAEISFEVSP